MHIPISNKQGQRFLQLLSVSLHLHCLFMCKPASKRQNFISYKKSIPPRSDITAVVLVWIISQSLLAPFLAHSRMLHHDAFIYKKPKVCLTLQVSPDPCLTCEYKRRKQKKVAPWDYLLLYFHTAWVSLHQTLSVLPLASLRGLMFWIERYCDLEQIPLALYSGFHVGRVFWDASQISFTFKTTDWASAHLGIDGIMTIFSGTCRVSREECIWAYAEHLSLATSSPCISRPGGPVFWVKYCSQLPGRLILASLSWRTEIKHWIHVCEKNEFLPERLRWLTKTSKAT